MARIRPYFENKYLLNLSQTHELTAVLKPISIADMHGEAGNYEILTIYYDTPTLDFFYDKIHGFFSKTKVRVRLYRNAFNQEWHDPHLEIKQRNGNLVNKHKIALKHEMATGQLLNWEPIAIREQVLLAFNDASKAGELAGKLLQPTIMVYYKRHARQFNGIEGLRFTFDSQMTGLSPTTAVFEPDFSFAKFSSFYQTGNVFEIKAYAEPPASILNQLENRGIHQQSHSKYSTSLLRQLQRDGDARLII